MKKIIITIVLLFLAGCAETGDDGSTDYGDVNFRDEMRSFVMQISSYAKSKSSGFLIIPQNGHELLSAEDAPSSLIDDYITAIDGTGREDLFYGYDEDDIKTDPDESEYLIELLEIAKNAGKVNLVTDYCSTHSKMDDSYLQNNQRGYISFAAGSRDLDIIPPYPATPYNENSVDVNTISAAKNFLYLLDPENYTNKSAYLAALADTNYDLLIIDAFYKEEILTQSELTALKVKKNGSKRLVISYMSIGEAETYRYYWQNEWESSEPEWLEEENPDWEGNYKVKYWMQEWQSLIYGSDSSYLDKILAAGFDGVYLDIIDAFEYFE
jgi:cysteinyl-tRNA synthetase